MDHDSMMFRLRPDTALIQDAQGWALQCGTLTQYAGNSAQTAILLAMSRGRYALDALISAAQSTFPDDPDGTKASLAMAEFILDFGPFLDA